MLQLNVNSVSQLCDGSLNSSPSQLSLRRPQSSAATDLSSLEGEWHGWPLDALGIEPRLPYCESGVLTTTLYWIHSLF